MGRSEESTRTTIRLTLKLRQQLQNAADCKGITLSKLIVLILKNAIDSYLANR